MVNLETFFEKVTSTLTYVLYDPATKDCVILDPVLDFDAASFQVNTHVRRVCVRYYAS